MRIEQVAKVMGTNYRHEGDEHRVWFGDRTVLEQEEVEPPAIERVNAVLVPTGEGSIQTGSGEGLRPHNFIPRTDYLAELLSNAAIPFRLRRGRLGEGMFRNEEYVTFVIDKGELVSQDTWVLVCNEAGNMTFVVYDPESFPDDEPPDMFKKQKLYDYSASGAVNPIPHTVSKEVWQDNVLNAILYKSTINGLQADAVVAMLPMSADEKMATTTATEPEESSVSPSSYPDQELIESSVLAREGLPPDDWESVYDVFRGLGATRGNSTLTIHHKGTYKGHA